MQTITYAKNMLCDNYNEIDATDYEALCKQKGINCYEYIPDDVPIKLYLDIDVKIAIPDNIDVCMQSGDCFAVRTDINDVLRQTLGEQYKEEHIYIGSSHGVVDDYFKISYRYVLNNILATKYTQKLFVDTLNLNAIEICDSETLKNYFKKGMFDTNPYKKNNQIIRSPYSSKEKQNRPMKIEMGDFKMSCITAFMQDDAVILPEIPETSKSAPRREGVARANITEEENELFKKGFHLLGRYAGAGNYCNWTTIIWAIKNVFDNYQIAKDFSQLDMKAYDENSLETLWENAEIRNDGVGLKSIFRLMKLADPTEYSRIFGEVYGEIRRQGLKLLQNVDFSSVVYISYFIKVDDIEDPYIVANTISKTLKNRLVLSNETWFIVDENNLWRAVKEPYIVIIEEIRKYLDYSNLQCVKKMQGKPEGPERTQLIEISRRYLRCNVTITHGSYMGNITKLLKGILCDNDFINKLDLNRGELAFKNGIIDLKTKSFRSGILPSDFLTKTIPFNYSIADENKKTFVKNVLLKILNNNMEHVEYYLSLIGFSFIGRPHLQKSMYFCVDNTEQSIGDNGKTLFFDILLELFPNYVYKTKAVFLEIDNKKVHKQLTLMKGKRLVWMDEFSKKQLNAELMKEIADGKTIENEVMFGTSEKIDILFKLFGLTNNMIKIDANDQAVYNRYKQISYGSHFDRSGNRTVENPDKLQFIADESLPDKLKTEYKNEITSLIIDYASHYLNSGKIYNEPKQFKADANETKLKNDEFKCWFNDNCAMTGKVALKHLIKESGMNEKIVKEGMTRLGFKYNKDLRKIGKDIYGKSYKGGYIGCSILEHTDNTQDINSNDTDIEEDDT